MCSGSVVLAAAGLLDGYRAATHWAMREQLARFGVEVSEERVCVDRNRFTGGGVTAGIDFGLTLIAQILGEDVARFTQLAIEYDPRPPFDSGSPHSAGPEAVARFREFVDAADRLMHDAVSRCWPGGPRWAPDPLPSRAGRAHDTHRRIAAHRFGGVCRGVTVCAVVGGTAGER